MPTTVDTTIGTGGGFDYSTFSGWESGTQGDLVAADEIRRGVISQAAYHETFSAAQTIAGATTDATRYRVLTVAASCSFADNSSNALRYSASNGAVLQGGTAAYTTWLTLGENYCVVERIQFRHTNSRGITVNATSARVQNALVYATGGSPLDSLIGSGSGLTNVVVIQTSNALACEIRSNTSLINCTFAVPTGNTYTAQMLTRAPYTSGESIKNCALFAAGQAALNSSLTFTNCYTDRASPPSGCTTVNYDTSTGSGFEAIADGSEDYRIKSTSALVDTGTATGAPSTDIFGRAWGASVEVGACAYVAAAAARAQFRTLRQAVNRASTH